MTASKNAERFDIWLVYLHFTDHPTVGKVRPVLIVNCQDNRIAAAKITSQPPRDGFVGEYALNRWSEAGLNVPSTVRCSQVFELDASELIRERPIGRLQQVDVLGVTEALRSAGFYGDTTQ